MNTVIIQFFYILQAVYNVDFLCFQKPLSDELPHADAAASSYDHFMAGGSMDHRRDATHHRYSKSHPAPLEVGMYVLLSFFGMAVAVFAASCVVYSWRGNVARKPPPSPMSTNDDEELTDSITNAHDWVWLGRATLERASGMGQPASNSSSNFVSLSDLNGNSPQQQSNPLIGEDSFREPEGRLVGQPNAVLNEDSPGSVSTGTRTGESDPLLPSTPVGTTFTRDSKGNRRVTFNNLSGAIGRGPNRPPIPPHRNIGVNAQGQIPLINNNSPGDEPPPVPPHGINVIANPLSGHGASNQKSKARDVFNPPKFVEVNADDFVRLRGVTRSRAGQIRRATILENPLLSAGSGASDSERQQQQIQQNGGYLPSQIMDYEQLVSYFSGLKESDA